MKQLDHNEDYSEKKEDASNKKELRKDQLNEIGKDLMSASEVPDDSMDSLLMSLNSCERLISNLLDLPKKERDQKLSEIERSLTFYKAITTSSVHDIWVNRLDELVENKTSNLDKNTYSKLIKEAKLIMPDQSISAVETLLIGDDRSLLNFAATKKIALEKELGVEIDIKDPRVVAAMKKDMSVDLEALSKNIPKKSIDHLSEACLAIKASPNNMLTAKEKTQFKGSFNNFLKKVVYPLSINLQGINEKIVNAQYIHGIDKKVESVSELEMSKEGDDFFGFMGKKKAPMPIEVLKLFRYFTYFSPFSILREDEIAVYNSGFENFEHSLSRTEKDQATLFQWKGMTLTKDEYKELKNDFKKIDSLVVGKDKFEMSSDMYNFSDAKIVEIKGWGNFNQKQKERYWRWDFEKSLSQEEKDQATLFEDQDKTVVEIKGWSNFSQKQKGRYWKSIIVDEHVEVSAKWDQEYWDKHSVLSFLAQTTLLVGAVEYNVYKTHLNLLALSKLPGFNKVNLLKKGLPAAARPWIRRTAGAYLGYLAANWVNDELIEGINEDVIKDLFEGLEKYGSVDKLPSDLQNEIRKKILKHELMLRRNYFQEVGYDLAKFDFNLLDKFMVSNVGVDRGSKSSMYKTGAFQEALLEANKKLNFLGFENFILS